MKKRKSGGGANWMDTYGDMVTLLLCFFVLLFSMSTLDQRKWELLVQSFNPDAIPTVTQTDGNKGPNADPATAAEAQQDIDQQMNELFEKLQEYVEQQGAGENISVTQGDGYIFISFNDVIFFDGNSPVLREDGKLVLDDIGTLLAPEAGAIDELRILGHTARVTVDEPNNARIDRTLSSNRAVEVLLYLQDMDIIDPARLVSMGYGEWRPVSGNGDGEERAHNRRVEMIITGKNLMDSLGDSIEQYYTLSGVEPPASDGAPDGADGAAAPSAAPQ